MPTIDGIDLTNVSTTFDALPDQEHNFEIEDVEEDKDDRDGQIYTIVSRVRDGEHEGRKVWDKLYMKTKEGKLNQRSLAQLKRYFAACCGEGYNFANPNTDDLKGLPFTGVTKQRKYKANRGEEKIATDMKAILPAQ